MTSYSKSSKIKRVAPYFPIRHTRVVMRVPEILRICRGKKVLHLGCADMPQSLQSTDDLLHVKLSKVVDSNNLWGLDSSKEGCQILRNMGFDRIIQGDVENLNIELKRHNFDIILAGEIIEHLSNPGIFVKNLTSLMKDNAILIVTTPNAFSFKRFMFAMVRREKVHYDHNFYFSYRTINHLLESYQLKCIDICYYQDMGKRGIPLFFDKVISTVTNISPLWADGIFARAMLSKPLKQVKDDRGAGLSKLP